MSSRFKLSFIPLNPAYIDYDLQPSIIPNMHTRREHDDWTVKFLERKLLGCTTSPWNHADYSALSYGFELPLYPPTVASGSRLIDVSFVSNFNLFNLLTCRCNCALVLRTIKSL